MHKSVSQLATGTARYAPIRWTPPLRGRYFCAATTSLQNMSCSLPFRPVLPQFPVEVPPTAHLQDWPENEVFHAHAADVDGARYAPHRRRGIKLGNYMINIRATYVMAAAHGGNSIITRHGKALRRYQQQKSDKNNTVIIIITGLPTLGDSGRRTDRLIEPGVPPSEDAAFGSQKTHETTTARESAQNMYEIVTRWLNVR